MDLLSFNIAILSPKQERNYEFMKHSLYKAIFFKRINTLTTRKKFILTHVSVIIVFSYNYKAYG